MRFQSKLQFKFVWCSSECWIGVLQYWQSAVRFAAKATNARCSKDQYSEAAYQVSQSLLVLVRLDGNKGDDKTELPLQQHRPLIEISCTFGCEKPAPH